MHRPTEYNCFYFLYGGHLAYVVITRVGQNECVKAGFDPVSVSLSNWVITPTRDEVTKF